MGRTRTGRGKRLFAALLVVVFIFTGMPLSSMRYVNAASDKNGNEQDQTERKTAASDTLIAHYLDSESSVEGTTIKDSSGNGKDAVLLGSGANISDSVLTFPGGASGSDAAYVKLPGELFEKQNTLTVSAWIQNQMGKGNYAALYFGGANMEDSSYWLMNPCNYSGNYKSVFTNVIDASKPYGRELLIPKQIPIGISIRP